MASLDTTKLVQVDFPETQYYKQEFQKNQIVLHHTASGRGTDGDFRHWLTTPERVATCVVVSEDGKIHQCFSSKYWGHHLGCTLDIFTRNKIPYVYRINTKGVKYVANNEILNQQCIAIEIDSWGGLTNKDGKWVSYTGAVVPDDQVIKYEKPFRGYSAFQKYTDAQIDSVVMLLKYWGEIYGIPLEYNDDIWDVNTRALRGDKGVFVHDSYRYDKSDCHPQPNLIEALKSLT